MSRSIERVLSRIAVFPAAIFGIFSFFKPQLSHSYMAWHLLFWHLHLTSKLFIIHVPRTRRGHRVEGIVVAVVVTTGFCLCVF